MYILIELMMRQDHGLAVMPFSFFFFFFNFVSMPTAKMHALW